MTVAIPIPKEVLSTTSFTQGDAKWEAYRKRALNDLYWFASVVLGYGDKIPMNPSTHLLLCKFLERKTGCKILDEAHYRKIEMPRETGKSTLARAYAMQRICKDPNIAILLINEKELLAKDFLSDIKYQFESNQLLQALFPELLPRDLNATTWSATRILVNRTTGRPDPTIDVIGVGGAVAGKHPDLIIADDMISREAMENARAGSWQIMHQTNRWVNQLDPLVNKGALPCPEITFIGTRWWHNDSYEHIEMAYGYDEEPKVVILKAQTPSGSVSVKAYKKGDLAIFRRAAIEDGRSIFPEKWDLEKLANIRMRDPGLFAANYMNEPSDDVTATFKADWLLPITWLDERQLMVTDGTAKRVQVRLSDLDKIILVDPGGFGERVVENRARAAAVCLGDDFAGHKFFFDCYSEQQTFLDAIRKIVEFSSKYGPRKIYVERAGQQAAFAQLLRVELLKANLNVPVDDTTLKASGDNKDVRILEMEPYFQRGEVFVGTGPNFHEFKQQYSQYPRAARKDILDILGYWPRLMRKHSTQQSNPDERRAKELSIYRNRRNWRGTAA